MQSACVSSRSSAARRPGSSRPGLEHLEYRNVPGSALRLSTLGADLGVLYQAALAPAAAFEDLARATHGAATQVATNVPDGRPAPVPALGLDNPLHQQAIPDVLSGGLPAGRAQALPGAQAALGTDPLSQAVQALVGGKGVIGSLKAGLGTSGASAPMPANVVADPTFAGGLPVGNPNWVVGDPTDPYVFNNPGGALGSEAMLGTVNGVNTITQFGIPTPAAFYTISFDWANDDTTGGPSQLAVEWNGVFVFNMTNPGFTGGYVPGGFVSAPVFTAPFLSTLTIIERNDPSYFHVTNVHAF
jgi:hypothetical protein